MHEQVYYHHISTKISEIEGCSQTRHQQALEYFVYVYFSTSATWFIIKLYFHFCNDYENMNQFILQIAS